MEIRQLKYFVKVAETLNFSEAARQLCVTQSTLSQQVKQLEYELGAQLLYRTSRNVTLTEAGRELMPYALDTIKSSELCCAKIADLNNMETGTLNIGVTYSFSPILTETLVAFMRVYPKIKLNIYYKPMVELMDMLRERVVDFVLAFKPTVPVDGIESHILFQNCLSVIVDEAHPLAAKKMVTLNELEKYDLALPVRGLQARNYFDHLVTPYNKFKIHVELNEVNILLKIIRQTRLVTVLAEATIHNETGVKAVPLDIPQNEMAGCVHTLRDSYRKRSMQEFIKLLSESLAVRERQKSWI
ncbi:MAG: LysR substrate-binding domain-containing protein [Bacteroides sp.]|nr:LysR substrate-binding domain-containing protein [Lachnospiraceae bacterium]MCM1331821.1 LysR substrate-binding domain-containing protein [Bacteroides sp.]MCM1390724.1 LysR substrate-binding domain-containing protein [Bacteroides sp.]